MPVKVNQMAKCLPQLKKDLNAIHKTAAEELVVEVTDEIDKLLGQTFRRRSSSAVYPDGSKKSNPGFADAKVKIKKRIEPAPNKNGYIVFISALVTDKSGKLHASWHIMTNGRRAIYPVRASVLRWFERDPLNVTKTNSLLVKDFNKYGNIVFRPYAKAVKGRKWYRSTKDDLKKNKLKDFRIIGWKLNIEAGDKI